MAYVQHLREELLYAEADNAKDIAVALELEERRGQEMLQQVRETMAVQAKDRWQPHDLDAISQQLSTGEVLLDYLLCDDELIVFVLPAEGKIAVERIHLGEYSGVQFPKFLNQHVANLYSHHENEYLASSIALGEVFLEPVDEHLAGAKALLVCPDGALHMVPFGAVATGDGKYAVEDFCITYVGNACSQTEQAPVESGIDSLVVGVSAFDGLGGSKLGDLPFARLEATLVAGVLESDPLLDDEATRDRLLVELPSKRIIHLATHGRMSSLPLLNGLYAYPESADINASASELAWFEDGDFIAMHEIMGLDLSGCELVVLSSCSSAAGDYSPGQGLMGLTQAFLLAGAETVIATQDRVDDRASLELIEEFYRSWLDRELTPAESMRQAQLSMLEQAQLSPPRYWAPFGVYKLSL